MDFFDPALTVALALAAGMVAQSIAHHLRLPGIVLLLAAGVALGPDVAGVIHPSSLGPGLQTLVGFAVAVILFEGGLNLNVRRLRREQRAIRQLVTVGALVTAAGGALAARLALGWDWRISILFGTLVIVTGPTVIQPLLRRIKVHSTVTTILEAEGVLIDAIGAIIAAVALEVALSPTETIAVGALHIAGRMGFGVAMGLAGGFLLFGLLRFRRVVPEGLENVFALGFALLIFQASNSVLHESGIAAVTVAGVVVGNTQSRVTRELKEFKEQLTVLLIGMLFVLLAADVRVEEVVALGWPGVWVVLAVMFVVRPLNVIASTIGAKVNNRERAFLAWIGPRGIVAAAVASLFAVELERAGVGFGQELRALVFLIIAATVLWSGLTGDLVARVLRLRRQRDAGWVVLGADELGRTMATLLEEGSEVAICIDSNPDRIRATEEAGLRALLGNGLERRTLKRAELDTRTGAIGLTSNEDTNLLFVEKARREAREHRYLAALGSWDTGITRKMVESAGAEVCFGSTVDVDLWSGRLRHGSARVMWWNVTHRRNAAELCTGDESYPPYLPLVHRSKGLVQPVSSTCTFREGDAVAVLMDDERIGDAKNRIASLGWTREDDGGDDEEAAEAAARRDSDGPPSEGG